MNQLISNLSKVSQLFTFGAAFIFMIAIFQLSVAPVSADYCDQFVTSSVCNGERSYDNCTLQYDGNRAYYDCHASQAYNTCTGKIYCGSLDKSFSGTYPSNVNPATNQPMAPTCNSVRTQTLCSKTMYEGCTLRYSGNEAWYDCTSPQNNQCQGSQRCESLDKSLAPAAPAIVNCPAGTIVGQNSQGTTVCVANVNNNSNNNANVSGSVAIATAQGGAGGSANVTINGIVQDQSQPVRVVTAGVSYVKQLPNTGLPAIALAGLGLLPLGAGLRGFRKGLKAMRLNDPSFIWENRQFKSQT